ncbi:MAG TPA: glycosyl hydrolase family 18 protein, partial [Polyangia bacterium]
MLAFAFFFGCSSSAKNASQAPSVTPGTPAPPDGTGGNGTTPPTTPTTPTAPPDAGVTPPASSDGGTMTPPPAADLGTTPPPADGGTVTPPPPPPLAHHRCGWMNDNPTLAKASLAANVDFFDAIHPYWWTLNATNGVTATSWPDDAMVISTAQAHNIKLMPLVYGGDTATQIRAVIASPAAIAAHVQVLVNLAVSHHYDGIELDYEHLWAASDRAGYTALVTQLAAGLHAQGKELSLAVPAL